MKVTFSADKMPDFVIEDEEAVATNNYNKCMVIMAQKFARRYGRVLQKLSETVKDGVITVVFNNGITVTIDPQKQAVFH